MSRRNAVTVVIVVTIAQELDFFGATKTGDVTSRLSADCQKVGYSTFHIM